jgi:uncharacterized membrane protein YeaQ/YmgE (transglycosylase-associated protein family)
VSNFLFVLTLGLAIGFGILEGELLSLIRHDKPERKHSNWTHGVVGALVGWLFGCDLPTIPEFRPWFALFTSIYGAAIYLFLQLFFTQRRFIGITRARRSKMGWKH